MPLDPVPNTTPIIGNEKPGFICFNCFLNLMARIDREVLFLSSWKSITQSDTPYAMSNDDEVIFANPDVSPNLLRVDLLPGQEGRLIRISNIKTGGAGTVAIYPNGADLIQPDVEVDPDAGPLDMSKGESFTLLFIEGYGWKIL